MPFRQMGAKVQIWASHFPCCWWSGDGEKIIPKLGLIPTFSNSELKGGLPPWSAWTLQAERAHPLPASSGPALGEEPRGGAELRGEQSWFLSLTRSGGSGTDGQSRGREPPGQGSGERVSSLATPPPCCALRLDPVGDEDGGGEVVPASDSLAGGVYGVLAKGQWLNIIGRVAGAQDQGGWLGWGRSPGSRAPTMRPGCGAHWQVVGWGCRGRIMGRLGGFRLDSRVTVCRGGVMPGIGNHNQHQRSPLSSLPAQLGGAAPSRGGAWSPQAAAGRRELSCRSGKGPQGRGPRVSTRPAAGSS